MVMITGPAQSLAASSQVDLHHLIKAWLGTAAGGLLQAGGAVTSPDQRGQRCAEHSGC